MERGEHLIEEGLQAIINIRASLNLGLSEVLKAAFPNTMPEVRPLIPQKKVEIPNEWPDLFLERLYKNKQRSE